MTIFFTIYHIPKLFVQTHPTFCCFCISCLVTSWNDVVGSTLCCTTDFENIVLGTDACSAIGCASLALPSCTKCFILLLAIYCNFTFPLKYNLLTLKGMTMGTIPLQQNLHHISDTKEHWDCFLPPHSSGDYLQIQQLPSLRKRTTSSRNNHS